MNDAQALIELTALLRDVFDAPELSINLESDAKSIPGWDSMKQVVILMAIEEKFGITISTREMAKQKNVGDLAALVAAKTGH